MTSRNASFPFGKITSKLRNAGCVFAEEEARLLVSAAHTPAELSKMITKRAAGEPLEYIVGWALFYGLKIEVGPNIFVPRRRTEFLVQQAAFFTAERSVVVDLCCGSGAVGAALAALIGKIELHATDIDPVAVHYARRNLSSAKGIVYKGDLYNALPYSLKERVNLIVANAPYVPTGQLDRLPAEARLHETRMALDGGEDGLAVHRRVASGACGWLVPGGRLLVEVSEKQIAQTVEIFKSCGLETYVVSSEDLDATVVIGIRPGKY
ncbi:putative protein N(5)-glutamine methyltransferase [Planococcus sp. N028]|uniref:peptide chain release factor N(5)-glutamine methyltransferase n=1 Tax=Planococcus shixiaomingii TaxID=3058393 RepID=A0ABT8MYU2_9BACL|nr:putative protein N(5)-glutamine methyltransferase [Planococcus sp. N028]MDN7240810.1 putative protein N(5)-glutamine methyltransferase [Planococcus sp. N028]